MKVKWALTTPWFAPGVLASMVPVLFFTDGVIEGRSASGEEFGLERLTEVWEQEWGSGPSPEEVLRRLVQGITDFNGGKLRDDATLLQLCWYGPGR